jgi:signal transduction histidine kinase
MQRWDWEPDREPARLEGPHKAIARHIIVHVAFWVVYFAFRTAAAHSASTPPPAELADFPFTLNRALVVASYAAGTGVVLALFLWSRSALDGSRYAILFLGALVIMPIMQVAEEGIPPLLGSDGEKASPIVDYAFMFGWALLLWAAAQALLDFHHRVVEQANAINRAQALAHDAQLKMLHYQINPHFLFNTLNAISSLVLDRRAEQAERMLLRLSGFLRYSLDRNPNELAPLGAELDAQRKYLEIEQTRFGEKLGVAFNVAADVQHARLPSLILQPILENAIKHAITPSVGGGVIEVSAWRDGDLLRLRIEDDGPGLAVKQANERRGVGLANVRERLGVMYGQRAGMLAGNRPQGGFAVEFWLPFEEEVVLETAIAGSARR